MAVLGSLQPRWLRIPSLIEAKIDSEEWRVVVFLGQNPAQKGIPPPDSLWTTEFTSPRKASEGLSQHSPTPGLGFGDKCLFVGEGGNERIAEKQVWEDPETLSIADPADTDTHLVLEGYPEARYLLSLY